MRVMPSKAAFREAWTRIASDTDDGPAFAAYVANETAAVLPVAREASESGVSRRGGPGRSR